MESKYWFYWPWGFCTSLIGLIGILIDPNGLWVSWGNFLGGIVLMAIAYVETMPIIWKEKEELNLSWKEYIRTKIEGYMTVFRSGLAEAYSEFRADLKNDRFGLLLWFLGIACLLVGVGLMIGSVLFLEDPKYQLLSIIGFCAGLLLPMIGLIFVAISQGRREDNKNDNENPPK